MIFLNYKNFSLSTSIKKRPLIKIIRNRLVYLPSPINISNFWNFGRLLGLFFLIQIAGGLILASHYISDSEVSFSRIDHIIRDVNLGWFFRLIHLNGARFFFFALYFHIGRGLYYSSYIFQETWNLGVTIFFLRIIVAFLGYVLPWGQIRFWGATVITNLISAIPIVGNDLVIWVWGGFSVGSPTLSRFFMLHFCVPFVIMGLIILHLFFLHLTGSHNPLIVLRSVNLIPFHWYFSTKDIRYFCFVLFLFELVIFLNPFLLGDAENFILANPLITPTHIVPEWYFLFAYAILRSIPNKLLGVLFLVFSIAILFLPGVLKMGKRTRMRVGTRFNIIKQLVFFCFVGTFFLLTWLGGQVVEDPFIIMGQLFLVLYFLLFFIF